MYRLFWRSSQWDSARSHAAVQYFSSSTASCAMNWPNSSLCSWCNTSSDSCNRSKWRLDVYVVSVSDSGIGYRWNSVHTSFFLVPGELGFSDWHYPGSRNDLMPGETSHFRARICEVTSTVQSHCWHSILCAFLAEENEKVRNFRDSCAPNSLKTERPGYIQHNSSK